MKKLQKRARDMGYGSVFIGLLFFLNPNLSYLDVLPDFIGCFFILAGLSSLLFLDDRAREAQRYARFLALLSGVRLVVTPVYFATVNADGGNTNMLLSFSFGIIGLLLELVFAKELFDLYSYLANRKNSEEGIRYLDAAKNAFTILIFAKNLGAMVPDMLSLFATDTSLDYNYNVARQTANLAAVRLVASVVIAVAVLALAIWAGMKLRRFFRESAREEAFLERLHIAAETEERDNRSLRIKFVFYGCFSILFFMALFCVDYYLDYVSVLPSFALFVLLFLLLKRLSVYEKPKKWQYAVCITGFVVSAAAYAYRAFYALLDEYVGETFHLQDYTALCGVAQALFCIAGFVVGAWAITRAVERQTGIELAPFRNIICVFCVLACSVNAYNYMMPKGGAVTDLMEFYVLLNLVIGITFALFTYRMQYRFRTQVEWKSF